MKKRTRNIILMAGIPLVSLLLFGAGNLYHNSKRVEEVQIHIDAQPDWLFLNVDQISEHLGLQNRALNQPVSQVNLPQLEQELIETGYVEKANAYMGAQGLLMLKVKLRRPVARFMPLGMEGFYLDEAGGRIPLSNTFSARVPVISGPGLVQDTVTAQQDSLLARLSPMLTHMARSMFWSAQIAEVQVLKSQELVLHTTVGGQPIYFGEPEGYVQKLENLVAFYKQVMPARGWAYYKSITVKFDGQIVATKR
jgi:cell division protein FtsQ